MTNGEDEGLINEHLCWKGLRRRRERPSKHRKGRFQRALGQFWMASQFASRIPAKASMQLSSGRISHSPEAQRRSRPCKYARTAKEDAESSERAF